MERKNKIDPSVDRVEWSAKIWKRAVAKEIKQMYELYWEELRQKDSEARKDWNEIPIERRKFFQELIWTIDDGLMWPKTLSAMKQMYEKYLWNNEKELLKEKKDILTKLRQVWLFEFTDTINLDSAANNLTVNDDAIKLLDKDGNVIWWMQAEYWNLERDLDNIISAWKDVTARQVSTNPVKTIYTFKNWAEIVFNWLLTSKQEKLYSWIFDDNKN